MYKARSELISFILLRLMAAVSLFIAGFPVDSAGAASVQSLAAGDGFYYYAGGQRIPLEPSLNWVSVKFASTDPAKQSVDVRNSGVPLESLDQARPVPHAGLTLLPLQPGVTTPNLMQGVNSMRAMPDRFLSVNPVFETPDAEMVITEEFIAAFSAGKTLEEISALNTTYGVEMVEPILGQENTFVLKVTPGTRLDALAMANLYQESGIVLFASPNFVRIKQQRTLEKSPDPLSQVGAMAGTNDNWYSEQYYLHNTGYLGNPPDVDIDAPEAWDKVTGNPSIIIAVIDEGVDRFHEDLSGKMVTGFDETGRGSEGSPEGDDSHGTAVAGIAAALSNNTTGISGVCRNCSIMPIRIAYDNGFGFWITQDSWQAHAIAFAYLNGAAILNNSWGGGSRVDVVTNAFNNAKALGRGGLGSVVVVSAGNDNQSTVSYPASLSSVIAVGASNLCDRRKTKTNDACNDYESNWGSNYGSDLDISAPGVRLRTTDMTGFAGYSAGNYYPYFNGTSGAAPIVSGVAGLVLSANPYLTANDVQAILQNTADDVNSSDVNGSGWDPYMGYGRVNANRAVQAALPVLARDTTGVFRPSNGLLYLKNTNSTGIADAALNYGLPGDYPVVGDWDGNGTVTIGIYRNGHFYLRNENTIGFATIVFPFGQPGDQPIAGDWDGDGDDTIGVYRPSNGQFFLRNSNSEGPDQMSFYLGNVGDVGVAGDWDGDGFDTTGVFRPSNGVIFLKNNNSTGFADIALNYGLPGDKPVMGDWNDDGVDTIGIYRNGSFYLRNSNTNGFAEIIFALGVPGDHPIAGNWDALP